jgi:hypothetical protein
LRHRIHALVIAIDQSFRLISPRACSYSAPHMRIDGVTANGRAPAARGFEAMADAIMYRWSVERDTWVSPDEVAQARAYLEHVGVSTSALPDGQFAVAGEPVNTLGAARLVLLGLKHVHAARRHR